VTAEAPAPAPAPAPTIPAPTAGTATLSWSAPGSANVIGYRVYYGTASRSYLQPRGMGLSAGNATTHVVTGLPRGYLYFFAVTAVGANDEESDFSNEATKHLQ
jgi:fibronectin type 3 domain-containing protein